MEPMFSIKEILEAVNDIQNKRKDKKSNIKEVTISKKKNDIPKNTLKLIEEAEKL